MSTQCSGNRKTSGWRGFTLIEILVVVAIISVLAAILFPVFARARENARRAACLSNMKQLGLGIMQYAQDFDESFPYHGNTTSGFNGYDSAANAYYFATNAQAGRPNCLGSLFPYVRSWEIYRCPSVSLAYAPAAANGYEVNGINDTTYYGNAVAFPSPPESVRRLASISRTAELIIMQETGTRFGAAIMRPARYPAGYLQWHLVEATFNGPVQETCSNNHFEGGNLLYADGHARWRKFTALRSSAFGLTPDDAYIGGSAQTSTAYTVSPNL